MRQQNNKLVKVCLRCTDINEIDRLMGEWKANLVALQNSSERMIGCGFSEDDCMVMLVELDKSRDVAYEMNCTCEWQLGLLFDESPYSNTGVG